MSMPYLGEIRLFAFNRCPVGWQRCDGSLLPIDTFPYLFNVLGTYYGGNGMTTFGVPDLRGRVPLHFGQGAGLTNRPLGEPGGEESVALTTAQMPAHRHAATATTQVATSATPGPALLPATVSGDTYYATDTTGATAIALSPQAVSTGGSGEPHANAMPTIAMQYCIALYGVYPTPS